MKKVLCLLLVFCMVIPLCCTAFATDGAVAPASEKKSIKIFTIGHSYGVDANWYLPAILKKAGYDEVIIGMMFKPGCSITDHYKGKDLKQAAYYKNTTGDPNDWKQIGSDGTEYAFSGGDAGAGSVNNTITYGLTDEDWDIIVMQSSVHGEGNPSNSDYEYLPKMIEYVNEKKTNPDAKLAWHMMWPNAQYYKDSVYVQQGFNIFDMDQMRMYDGIVDVAKNWIETNEDFDYIIPVGTVMMNMMKAGLGDNYTRDSYHLHYPYGCYPAALTWAKVLCGVDIDTLESPTMEDLDDQYRTQTEFLLDDEFMAMAKTAINDAVENPFEIAGRDTENRNPEMVVDFGTPVKKDGQYTYTATVYLDYDGNLVGVGAYHDKTNKTVTNTSNYAGTKIKDWNLDIVFADAGAFVSAGAAESSLKSVISYENGEAVYTAQDMSASFAGGTLKIASTIGGDIKKAYPYYGTARSRCTLGTVTFTTNTNNFTATLSGNVALGETSKNGEFKDALAGVTYATDNYANKVSGNKSLEMAKNVTVSPTVTIEDNPADGLITSEAELREALTLANLSTDKSAPTELVLGADIILDDGAATPDDLTDGGITITAESATPVYVNIDGNEHTIKNMQNLQSGGLFKLSYVVMNLENITIDANYGNDSISNPVVKVGGNREVKVSDEDRSHYASLLHLTGGSVTLNNGATLMRATGAVILNSSNKYEKVGGNAVYLSKSAKFTMNEGSKLTSCISRASASKNLISVSSAAGPCVFTLNGGEITGNELSPYGIIYRNSGNATALDLRLNSGKITGNAYPLAFTSLFAFMGPDCRKRCILDGSVEFDEGKGIFYNVIGAGSYATTLLIKSPLQQNITLKLGPGYSDETNTKTLALIAGSGYTPTFEDFQKLSFVGLGEHRVAVYNSAIANKIATSTSGTDDKKFNSSPITSYVPSVNPIPEGSIYQDGTIVGQEPEVPELPTLDTKVGGTQKTLDSGKKRLYLFAGIDSLDYNEVGFEVTAKGTTAPISTTTVYNSINVTMNGAATVLTPSQFGETANYIFGKGIAFPATFAGEAVKVKAYAKTKDNAIIYAKESSFTIKND